VSVWVRFDDSSGLQACDGDHVERGPRTRLLNEATGPGEQWAVGPTGCEQVAFTGGGKV